MGQLFRIDGRVLAEKRLLLKAVGVDDPLAPHLLEAGPPFGRSLAGVALLIPLQHLHGARHACRFQGEAREGVDGLSDVQVAPDVDEPALVAGIRAIGGDGGDPVGRGVPQQRVALTVLSIETFLRLHAPNGDANQRQPQQQPQGSDEVDNRVPGLAHGHSLMALSR